MQIGIDDLLQPVADGAEGVDRGQALLGVAFVHLQVLLDQGLQQEMGITTEVALLHQDLPQGPGLVQDPGIHGLDEGIAADKVHLQRQDAKEKVAVG
jgi:hypothetical protein